MYQFLSRFTLMVSVVVCVGCSETDGPDTVTTSGTITMDGKPLADANVIFLPVDASKGLRMGTGRTNSSGYFTLDYSSNKSGMQPGEYKVSISTFRNPVDGNLIPESVPVNYNSKSELSAVITADGGKSFDFALKSDAGKTIQPSTDSY